MFDRVAASRACGGDDVGFGWTRPTHIADNGCNRTCLGTKIGMAGFVRRNIRVNLGNDGRSYMMARGYGTIGHLKDALFVPGLLRDLISTQQFDIEGRQSCTRGHKMEIWANKIDKSDVLFTFDLSDKDNLYHWRHPYEELTRSRLLGVECKHSVTVAAAEQSNGLGAKVRQAVTDVTGDGDLGQCNGQPLNSKLAKVVRKEVRRVVRGSRGTHNLQTTVGLNGLQQIHCRLGHVHPMTAKKMLKTGAATGMGSTFEECKDEEIGLCDACLRGKTNALSVPTSETAAAGALEPFESMHMDLKEMTCMSMQKNHVVTWIVDEATDMQYVYHSKTKMAKDLVVEQTS
jgi:hypothetical protein